MTMLEMSERHVDHALLFPPDMSVRDHAVCSSCGQEGHAGRFHVVICNDNDWAFLCSWRCVTEYAEGRRGLAGDR